MLVGIEIKEGLEPGSDSVGTVSWSGGSSSCAITAAAPEASRAIWALAFFINIAILFTGFR